MDRSHELWSLVEGGRSESSPLPPLRHAASAAPSPVTSASLCPADHPIRVAAKTIETTATETLHSAAVRVRELLAALDGNTTASTALLLSNLLLSEAELLSVATSVKEYVEHLQRAAAQNGVATGLSHLIAHHLEAASILGQQVATARLQLTLAKEELSLFKAELHLFGHVGVLSCSEEVATELRQWRETRQSKSTATTAKTPPPSSLPEALRDRPLTSSSKSATVTAAAAPGFHNTFRVVDGVFQRAAETVRSAGSHADSALHLALTSSQAAARQLLQAGAASVSDVRNISPGLFAFPGNSPASSSSMIPPLPAAVNFNYTETEEAALEQQSMALLQAQREATAQDAKIVEASVRELSQLTSLMSDQVVQQSEQVATLLRNTEATQTNMSKAVEEVQKPLASFWNPTRQLICLLWVCTGLLLSVNWAAR